MLSDVTLEIGIYIHRFHNLDLFQQGWYGIKVTSYWEGGSNGGVGVPSRVIQYQAPENAKANKATGWHIDDDDSSYHTRIFHVQYARQDVSLQDYVSFHLLFSKLETSKMQPAIIKFELLFASMNKEQNQKSPPGKLQPVAKQLFRLIPVAFHGLHTYCPVQFDSFHHVLVDVNIHTVVLCLGQQASIYTSEDPGRGGNKCIEDNNHVQENETSPPVKSNAESNALDRLVLQKVHGSCRALLQDLAVFKCICEEGTVEEVLRDWPGSTVSLTKLARSWSESKVGYVLSVSDAEIERDMERRKSQDFTSTSEAAEPKSNVRALEDMEERRTSVSDTLEESQGVARDLSSLWNAFLTFHRLHHLRLCQYLKRRWEDAQWMEYSMWVVRTELCMEVNDVFGVEGGDWAARWRSPRHTLSRLPQQERALNSAFRAEMYRKQLSDAKCKHSPLQDLALFSAPEQQPVLFVERHVATKRVATPNIDLTPPPPPPPTPVPHGETPGPEQDMEPLSIDHVSVDDVSVIVNLNGTFEKIVPGGAASPAQAANQIPRGSSPAPSGSTRSAQAADSASNGSCIAPGGGPSVAHAADVADRWTGPQQNSALLHHGMSLSQGALADDGFANLGEERRHLSRPPASFRKGGGMEKARGAAPNAQGHVNGTGGGSVGESNGGGGEGTAKEKDGGEVCSNSASVHEANGEGRRGGKTTSSGTHVIVFVHGFQGHHLDLRVVRNQWLILDPTIEILMSEANEEHTFEDFREMGQRLAQEVVTFLSSLSSLPAHKTGSGPSLGRLSFVGHSIGTVIIRAALTEPAMAPYLQYLHTFLSISGPHLGYLYSANSLFNSGLWLLKRFKNSLCMHQLTFSDEPNFRNCFLFKLSQAKTFELFKHVLLLASPQDRYVPYHSARIEICPAAMRDPKRGASYAAMVQGCLAPLLQANAECVRKGVQDTSRVLVRCDVNFYTSSQARSFNNLIGRTAHIEFLETDSYIRFFLWAYRDCFV